MKTTTMSEGMLADAVRASAHGVVASLSAGSSGRSRHEWLVVAADCQSLINTVTAVQDLALAEAARRECLWREDGTVGEAVHAPGRVTIDAADVAAPVLGASHAQAQLRMEQAVRLAAGRAPVEADGGAPPEDSGLQALHTAMAAGRLDGYRAGVVAHELEGAPAAVTEAVVTALEPHLDADAPTLRRRARRLLARISPDLLRQRADRARSSTGLRRWVAEPGVDAWFGTFPSEEAAVAWAAVDRLAHELVSNGMCSSVEQARGKALTDLVTGNATVDVEVVLTVPATVTHAEVSTVSAPVVDDAGDALLAAPSVTVDALGASSSTGRAVQQATQCAGPQRVRPRPHADRSVATTSSRCRGPGRPSRSSSLAAGSAITWRPPSCGARVASESDRTRPSRGATHSAGPASTQRTTWRRVPTVPAPPSWRWSAHVTAGVASRDVRSPPGSATSTTRVPGPRGRRRR